MRSFSINVWIGSLSIFLFYNVNAATTNVQSNEPTVAQTNFRAISSYITPIPYTSRVFSLLSSGGKNSYRCGAITNQRRALKKQLDMTNLRPPSETDQLIFKLHAQSSNDDVLDSPRLTTNATTGQKILDLAVPAAGALLIDPLMTLVDTAFVGRFTTSNVLGTDLLTKAAPLAGMGSATALLTFTFYLFNFLCTTTTPLVALKRSSGSENEAITLSGQVLSLALFLGSVLTILLFSFKQPLLRIMGTDNTGMEANSYAMAFLSVRAFSAPAVLCIEASTGVLRGYLDTKTPIVVLVVANLINLLLDVVLVVIFGLGPMGAAIATTTAEWISAALFLAVLAGQLPSASEGLGNKNKNYWSRNVDRDHVAPTVVSILPVWALPSWVEVQPLFVASTSAFFRAVVLQVSISSAAAMVARGGGDNMESAAAASVAAHQIGMQLWLLCSFFCDSLAAASQGLIADALGRRDSDEVLDISKTIFLYSFYLGLTLALLLQVGTWTNWLLVLFTEDPATRLSLGRILPLIVLAQPVNALVFAADGVLQGAAEFPFQAKAMTISGLTALGSFVALEAIGPADADTLIHVWYALIALQLMRGFTSLWKLVDRNGPIDLLSSKDTPS
jgi:Na+-driven multidrug efflux pump